MQITDNESKKIVSSWEESLESGEISSFSSEWKIGSDKLFVTCLNCDGENKRGKPIKNYFDHFIKTSLNRMSIRSWVVAYLIKKSISNSEQLFNATDLSPITFGVILPPNLHNKYSTNSQINQGTLDENWNSKVYTIKMLLDSGASTSMVCKKHII